MENKVGTIAKSRESPPASLENKRGYVSHFTSQIKAYKSWGECGVSPGANLDGKVKT